MNFIVFPVGTTNIFPLANSTAGGQLLTEFNLRSRESVATDSSVKYMIGPSYTHSTDDFLIQGDSSSSTVLKISAGKALVNGHYVESLTDITIDLANTNYVAIQENIDPLKGKLAVGLRMAYSTYETLAGSALVENDEDYYEGIQVVIVPEGSQVLPTDAPGENDFTKVNMHLLLGTFRFSNGRISSVTPNDDRIRSIPAERISNIDNIISSDYISRKGLDSSQLYVYSGKKRLSDGTYAPGWCGANESLMVWDKDWQNNINRYPNDGYKRTGNNAEFLYNSSLKTTYLAVPHKQLDGVMYSDGTEATMPSSIIKLPDAKFTVDSSGEPNTGGVVSPAYTRRILNIEDKINLQYKLPNGRMRGYISVLNNRDELPTIPRSKQNWPYSRIEWDFDLSNISSRLTEVESELNQLSKAVNSLTIQGLDSRITEIARNQIDASLNDIIIRINTISSNLSDLADRVSILEGSSSGDVDGEIISRITQLSATITSLQTTVSDLSNSVNNINNAITISIAEAKDDLDNQLNLRIEEAVADIKSYTNLLKNQLETAFSDQLAIFRDNYNISPQDISSWKPGDYILVGEDLTVEYTTTDGRSPSTMYVVVAGQVVSVELAGDGNPYCPDASLDYTAKLTAGSDTYAEDYAALMSIAPNSCASGVPLATVNVDIENVPTDPISLIDYTTYKGAPMQDYFVVRVRDYDTETRVETWKCYYYLVKTDNETFSYSNPIFITGSIPLATTDAIGGFVNVPSDQYGNGYVYRNEYGYLQLLDYERLATGFLAYQLGENYDEGAGISSAQLQSILNEYVNDRITFPSELTRQSNTLSGKDPNVIYLTIQIPDDATADTIFVVQNISCWYGTHLHVSIYGNPSDTCSIVFRNCEKLRFDTASNITSGCNIYLQDVNLYYDSTILDRVEIYDGLSLWYESNAGEKADIQVDGMTVTSVADTIINTVYDPWSEGTPNDNHYIYGIKSLTFDKRGNVTGMSIQIQDTTTGNIEEGDYIFVQNASISQSIGLSYPASRMIYPIKVNGSFVSGYWPQDGTNTYILKRNEFTCITNPYTIGSTIISAEFAIYTNVKYISGDVITGVTANETIHGFNSANVFVGNRIDYNKSY